MQRETRFTTEQILDMDDDQLLFWYSGGKSAAPARKRAAVSMKLDGRKTWAENMAEVERRRSEWEVKHGKDR